MTDPVPTPATQTKHPWRATVRTVLAAIVAFLPFLPEVVHQFGADSLPWVAGIVAAAGAVTRVLAMPGVDGWLRKYLPFLAAQPANGLWQGPT